MSRAQSGDPIYVKPSNNMYTVLSIVAFLVTLLAFVILFMRAKDLLDNGLFG